MKPEYRRRRQRHAGAAAMSSATYGLLAGRINPLQGGRPSASAGGAPRIRGSCPPVPAATQNDQFVTSVVMRLGTSPTGMTALTVLLSVSMAGTDLMAALEMWIVLPSVVKVAQFGTDAIASCPGRLSAGSATSPISLRSASE